MVVTVTYISWSIDFALHFEDNLMYEDYIWDYGSVWHDIWPQNKCRALWPIFHGPVILSSISNTKWCMNVIFSDNEIVWPKLWTCKYKSTWPIVHGLMILFNIFKIIWLINIIVGIKDRCDTLYWSYQVYVGQWPIFYGPVNLLHILKTVWWRNVVLGIIDQCHSKIYLVNYRWVNDLYFMVHYTGTVAQW